MKEIKSKIVVIIFQSLRENSAGGFGALGYEVATELHKRGEEVCLLTINKGPYETPFPSYSVFPFSRFLLRVINKIAGLKIIKPITSYKMQEYLFDWFLSLKTIKAQTVFTTFPLLPRTLKRMKRTVGKVVLIPQNPDERYIYEECLREARTYNLPIAEDAYIDKWRLVQQTNSLPFIDQVVSISEVTHRSYQSFHGKRALLPYYVRRDLGLKPGAAVEKATPFVYLFIAHIVILKGLHHLLEAWSKCAPEMDAELWIVGGIHPDLKIRMMELFPTDKIRWLGHRSDIREIILQSKVVIIPSLIDNEPQTALEALTLKIPVIISDGCGNADWIGQINPDAVYKVGNIDALVNIILYAYNNFDNFNIKYSELYKYVYSENDKLSSFVENLLISSE